VHDDDGLMTTRPTNSCSSSTL